MINLKLVIFKVIFSFLFFFCINFQSINAQDYKTIFKDRITYFEDIDNNIKCIRIDSTKTQVESMYYPMSNILQYDSIRFFPNISSWIGKSILIKNNGDNIFINKDNDSIVIKTSAKLNQKWKVYSLKDSILIYADVIAHDTLTLFGQKDSIKTIKFQVYDKNMLPINSYFDSLSIDLSKNYGFYKTLNFNLFPFYEMNFNKDRVKEYKLVGISNPNLGVQNLTNLQIFDFQSGDEIHTIKHSEYWNSSQVEITSKKTVKVLERWDYIDSVKYKFIENNFIDSSLSNVHTYSSKSDTLVQVYKANSFLDKQPGEVQIDDNGVYFSTYMKNDKILSKIDKRNDELFFVENSDSSLFVGDITPCSSFENFYYLGLGGPYYEYKCPFQNFEYKYNKLVYYKKGTEIWGNPLILSSVNEEKFSLYNTVQIFPNPTKDFISLISNEKDFPIVFELYDLNGQNLLKKELNTTNTKIDISTFKNGLYLYTVKGENGSLNNGKIIKN